MNPSVSSDAPESTAARQTYALGPFLLDSELWLPELRGPREAGLHPVHIALGEVPRQIPNGVEVDPLCTVSATEYLLNIPGVARYYAGHGTEVRLEVERNAAPEDVRLYLLGSVFGALCHQNGFLPLHASAVEVEGKVTAFLGDSGAGKSTLAAFLGRKGYRIVSDDICLLDVSQAGPARVIPVAGWLKLWRKSLDVLGEPAQEENRLFSEDDKFRVYLGSDHAESLTLEHVVFLRRPEPAQSARPAELHAMTPASALAGLMQQTYLRYLPEQTGGRARLFAHCGQLLGRAVAFSLVAPLGWEHMDGVLDLIERRLLLRTGT